jgi:hypothetical protein
MTHRVAPRARRHGCAARGRKAGEHKKRRRIGVDLLDPELGEYHNH